jgi:hypothetical protein
VTGFAEVPIIYDALHQVSAARIPPATWPLLIRKAVTTETRFA